MYYTQAKLREALPSEDLFALLAEARQTLADFQLLPEKNGNSGEFKFKGHLSKFLLPAGIHVTNVPYISGSFKAKADPVEEVARMAIQAGAIIELLGSFDVQCVYKLRGLEDIKYPEECGIRFWRGKLFFSYDCRVESHSWRKEYFQNLIGHTGLPIQMSEDQRGYYLQHAQGGLLRPMSGGVFGENPMGFWCEMAGQDPAAVVPFVRAALQYASAVSSGSWTVVAGEENHLGLEAIAAQNFPCDGFDINFGYTLDNLEVLESLQAVMISGGFFATNVAGFTLDDAPATLTTRTRPKGHTLYADIPRGSLEELNQKLGVTLVPDDE